MNITLFKKKNGSRVVTLKEAYEVIRNPYRDWMIILRSFFVLVLIVMLVSAYIYVRADKNSAVNTPTETVSGRDRVNVSKLKSVIESFAHKEQRFNELKTTKPLFVDPSL